MLGELVLRFLIESALLAATWVAIAGLATLVMVGAGAPKSARTFVFALVGAVTVGSLARRLGLPVAWELDLGRRALPVVWSIGGALAGAALAAVRPRRAAGSSSVG
jgi:hypothetical protein